MRNHARQTLIALTILAALAGSVPAGAEPEPRVVATYFHRTLRCQTCLRIESLARRAVTETLASDTESGRLVWRLVNMQETENEHVAEEFELESPMLVLTLEDGGDVIRWQRLDRIWQLVDDEEAFHAYVLRALEEYLDAASGIVAETEGRQDVR